MLKENLTEDLILLKIHAEDWEAAVRAGGELLYQARKCDPDYIEAMVRTVREMGPYMVLAPGLALAHARPEDGVREIGLSLITLNDPVEFGSKANDPVAVVISFCATDQESHVDLLKALAVFLRVEENQALLKTASDIQQILDSFDNQGIEVSMKALRIMTVCGFGLGTSLILRMTVDEVLSKYKIKADTFCVDADTAVGQNFDIVITSQDMKKLFKDCDQPVVVIDNFLSTDEVEEKAIPVIQRAIEERG